MAAEQGDKVTLRVIVDKERNQVVYAEAGKDFVDVLFSFLTFPLGTIARLVAEESNIEAVRFGSLSSLYQSVSDLDQQHLWSQHCKEMLLKPRNSLEGFYQNLKMNIDDIPRQVFLCENMLCRSSGSIFKYQKCQCGKLLKTESHMAYYNGFVKKSATFIIHGDLTVMPNDLGTILCLLQKRGISNIADIEKKTILIGKKEVADLLKLSLLSKTPLTDFVLKKKPILICNSNQNFQPKSNIGNGLPSSGSDEGKKMVVKVLRRTSTRKILFATAEEDFADFLFSFLTFPFGTVLQMLEGFSSISCMDNLYTSIKELSPERCFESPELKDKLAKPTIFSIFQLRSKIFPIEICTISNNNNQPFEFIDPKSPVSGGYTRGPLAIMVTDDLVVTPMSSIDGISYLERMKIPLNDVEETVVSIGLKEGLSILKASLTSTSVLTNSLNQYIGSGQVRASVLTNAASTDILKSQRKKMKVELTD
ncbi:hypothetical protein P8452_59966 [Trifolium repens]|nr:hypothetical protein P8452_59966 [Trifolium repens]